MSRQSRRDTRKCVSGPWMLALALYALFPPLETDAGGSGLNVLIVANQDSTNSVELANYYRSARQIPPEHVLKISWPGSNIAWTHTQFTNSLLNPVLDFVAQNQLSDQIQYVVLSMDIPYRISGGQENSTTAAVFYGFKGGTTNLDNSYAQSESRFTLNKPDTAATNSFLTTMLTANTLDEAKHMVDQGTTSDHTFPSERVWLVKSSDPARNIRYKRFDNAILNSRLCDDYDLWRTNLDSSIVWTNFLGCQLGVETFSIVSNAFVPGTIADNFTSFSGKIFENPGQTTLLEFIEAGACGSYGTVTEPLGVVAKFPDPMVYFYQARGYNLAECYYQSVVQPFQGLFVGEPLAAPWRRIVYGGWCGMTNNAVVQGATNLCLSFTPDMGSRPLDQIDLFINGRFLQTLTNITPQAGNLLTVQFNGYPVTYQVPTNATLETIATGFASELNQSIHTNVTKVTATPYGDRIELQSFAEPLPAGMFEVIDTDGTTNTSYLAAPGPYSVESTVSTPGLDGGGNFKVQFESAPGVSNVLEASTNLFNWTALLTNEFGGLMDFVDPDAALYPHRFYRVAVAALASSPYLIPLGITPSNTFGVRIVSETNRPYVLQTSSDWRKWSDVFTNGVGGEADFFDGTPATQAGRFYRTRSGDSNDYAPVRPVGQTPSGGNVLHIEDTSPSDIVVWSSTTGSDWKSIFTYSGAPGVQTSVQSRSGSGEPVTTRLDAASPEFLTSEAYGIREYLLLDFLPSDGIVSLGQYLRLTVTKTNGPVHVVGLTNTVGSTPFASFVQQFVAIVNAEPALQEADGLVLEDLVITPGNTAHFNVRARSNGREAAQIRASLEASVPGFATSPSGDVTVNQNIGDLLPRNHLCVSAGSPSITHYFDLDTTGLPDGFHELTAVAYEGTHVNSQTLTTRSIIVSNTALQATLALAAPGPVLKVTDQFDLVITANTADLQEILLFTTGGFYEGRTNQSAASFHVMGQDLGVGDHPFHALVTTTNGLSYRTAKVNVTITR